MDLVITSSLIAVHAAFAIWGHFVPGATVFHSASTIGAFVDPDHAAVHFTLGVACCFGVLAWRSAVVLTEEMDDEEFQLMQLISLRGDKVSVLAFIALGCCLAGLLMTASLVGIFAAGIGLLLGTSFNRLVQTRLMIPVLIGVCVAIWGVAVLSFEPVERGIGQRWINAPGYEIAVGENDRWRHWKTAFHAGNAYFPSGAGVANLRRCTLTVSGRLA